MGANTRVRSWGDWGSWDGGPGHGRTPGWDGSGLGVGVGDDGVAAVACVDGGPVAVRPGADPVLVSARCGPCRARLVRAGGPVGVAVLDVAGAGVGVGGPDAAGIWPVAGVVANSGPRPPTMTR